MTSPYLDMAELATYLRFVDHVGRPDAARALRWAHRTLATTAIKKRGRSVLVLRFDVEQALGGADATARSL